MPCGRVQGRPLHGGFLLDAAGQLLRGTGHAARVRGRRDLQGRHVRLSVQGYRLRARLREGGVQGVRARQGLHRGLLVRHRQVRRVQHRRALRRDLRHLLSPQEPLQCHELRRVPARHALRPGHVVQRRRVHAVRLRQALRPLVRRLRGQDPVVQRRGLRVRRHLVWRELPVRERGVHLLQDRRRVAPRAARPSHGASTTARRPSASSASATPTAAPASGAAPATPASAVRLGWCSCPGPCASTPPR
jgi:hypothetical protein